MSDSFDGQNRPLREQLKRYLSSENLSDAQYARFQQLLASKNAPASEEQQSPDGLPGLARHCVVSKRQWIRTAAWSTGAALVTLSGAGFWLSHVVSKVDVKRIAEEALTNHLKVSNPDFVAQSVLEVRKYLHRLDFIPVEPSQFTQNYWQMLGARYCTLQGAIAAHIMYVSEVGVASHYQAAYCPIRFGKLPNTALNEIALQVTQGGATIRIWQESGLTMVGVVS